jgi:8-oxo-dGTP pyrophosphatase MutT (NUDIX family)
MEVLLITNVVIKNGEKVLLGRRTPHSKFFPNYWCIPGGKLEKNENPINSAIREIKEETGLKVKVTRLLEVSYQRYQKENCMIFLDFKAVPITSKLEPIEKLVELRWFKKREIDKIKMTQRDRKILKKYW